MLGGGRSAPAPAKTPRLLLCAGAFACVFYASPAQAEPDPPAQDLSTTDPPAPAPEEPPAPAPEQPPTRARDASDLLVPTPAEWRLSYEEARAKLLAGEFADAAARFAELEATAVNRVDRALARAQRTLAEDWTSRNLVFVRRQDLADPALSARALDRRSTDELVSLYTNSVVYGIGSAVWLGVLTEPRTPAAAIVPGLALTAASVGTVIALDSGRGFRYGVPQAIVSGMWIGFEHGLVWTFWHDSRDSRPRVSGELEGKPRATILWGLSTIGAVTGGILGQTLGTTPGRSAWVGSTALWTGAIAGFGTGGLVQNGDTEALAIGGIGLTVGTGIGLLTASSVSPSIGRTRLIDLSGLLGGLGTAAFYAAAARNESSGQAASGLTALGITGGLAIGWLATSGMAKDSPRSTEPKEESSTSTSSQEPHARTLASTQGSTLESIAAQTRPLLMPQPSGAIIGAGGTF